jgi:sulfate adenylyltransferase
MIKPHGGVLVNRLLEDPEKESAIERAKELSIIRLSKDYIVDLKNIAYGRYSPLEGFITEEDYKSVISQNQLKDGTIWTIPIVLDVDSDTASNLKEGGEILLTDESGSPIAILHLEEKFSYDKETHAKAVFGTNDTAHPGVERVHSMNDVLLGGKIDLIDDSKEPFPSYNLSPAETRKVFEEKGWKTVAGFQPRNTPHMGHENMQKTVLALVDGLLIHPVIGRKKKGDFRDEVILKSYDALIENYFPQQRVLLSILPMEMRYAGPKEAVHHAIIRKNHGCTHLIVGRDHAGVGNFYHHEAAIEIFDDYPELEIKPITIRGDFFHCRRCGHLASDRTCCHDEDYHMNFNGTAIRKMLVEGVVPPPELIRSEVYEAQREFDEPFVE